MNDDIQSELRIFQSIPAVRDRMYLCLDRHRSLLVSTKAYLWHASRWFGHPRRVAICHKIAYILTLWTRVVVLCRGCRSCFVARVLEELAARERHSVQLGVVKYLGREQILGPRISQLAPYIVPLLSESPFTWSNNEGECNTTRIRA